MYAVIETGGKQYRVEVGTELEVEFLDAAPGDAITDGPQDDDRAADPLGERRHDLLGSADAQRGVEANPDLERGGSAPRDHDVGEGRRPQHDRLPLELGLERGDECRKVVDEVADLVDERPEHEVEALDDEQAEHEVRDEDRERPRQPEPDEALDRRSEEIDEQEPDDERVERVATAPEDHADDRGRDEEEADPRAERR